MTPYNLPEFRMLALAVLDDWRAAPVLSDWLKERGVPDFKADESLLPYLPSQYLPRHYYNKAEGMGSGRGIGRGMGSGRGSGSGMGRGIGSGSGIGSGRGRGSGSGTQQERIIMEIGKAYLIETVDWFAWVGRVVKQIGPWEYELESCSKISDTNAGDIWNLLAAGNKEARKKATYIHYTVPVILGMGVVVKILWKGKTPQEEGLPG